MSATQRQTETDEHAAPVVYFARGVLLYDTDHRALALAFDAKGPWLDSEFGRYFDLSVLGDPREGGDEFRASAAASGHLDDANEQWASMLERYGSPSVAVQYEMEKLCRQFGVSRADLPCLVICPASERAEPVHVSIPKSLAEHESHAKKIVEAVLTALSSGVLAETAALPEQKRSERIARIARKLERDLRAIAGKPTRRGGGRPRACSDDFDRRCNEAWESREHKTKESLALALGASPREVRLSLDRTRQSAKKKDSDAIANPPPTKGPRSR